MQMKRWLALAAIAAMGAASMTATAQDGEPPASAPAEVVTDGETSPAPPGPAAPVGTGTATRPATRPADTEGQEERGWQQFIPMFLMIGGLAVLWLWMGRGRKKEQQRRRAMIDNLKKGDKVTSIGGIIGTVLDVKGDEVTVKVDESANVRMKMAKWAIRGTGETAKAENMSEAERQQSSQGDQIEKK
jgi:preprotein translocase subunit YajC